jgi:hypothetical protein
MGAAGDRPRRLATAARRWPVARDRSPAWFGTCLEGFLCAPVARAIFLPQDLHIFLPRMIAVADGGTNAMGVSKNVRAWRCTRCPARLQACCPGRGLLLLVAWASADARHVLLQQPRARHPSPILEGLLSRYRLARGAFASLCRSFACAYEGESGAWEGGEGGGAWGGGISAAENLISHEVSSLPPRQEAKV